MAKKKNIEITLNINGEDKTFVCTIVKGILLRETASIVKVFSGMENGFDEDVLDEVVDYVVNVFNGQFTRDDFYNGIDLADMMPTIQNIAEQVMEKATSKLKN